MPASTLSSESFCLDTSIFVLGAPDPEMDRMKQVLSDYGLPFIYALDGPDQRVNPRTAYSTAYPLNLSGLTPIFVECAPSGTPRPSAVIDHHRIGDPGYDSEPKDFATAASIGQLSMLLGLEMTHPDEILAAMDHCFAAAVRGECPGVSPEDVISRKIDSIVDTHDVPFHEVQRLIRISVDRIESATEVLIGETSVKDLRNIDLGPENSLAQLTMVTAQALTDSQLLLTERVSEGVEKVTLRSSDPNVIRHFMGIWTFFQGYPEVYGVPNRGYAGAYIV